MEEEVPSITRTIIHTVRDYPIIYNKHHPDYLNKEKIAEAWKEISLEVNLSANKAQKRWRRLRDRYRKHRQAAFFSIESSKYINWRWHEELSFLDEFTPIKRPPFKLRETPQMPTKTSSAKNISNTVDVAEEKIAPVQKTIEMLVSEESPQSDHSFREPAPWQIQLSLLFKSSDEKSPKTEYSFREHLAPWQTHLNLLFKSPVKTFKNSTLRSQAKLEREMAFALSRLGLCQLERKAAINEHSPKHSETVEYEE